VVKLNKIYTRTGDNGSTGLVDASRCLKDDLRVEAYGTVDETNATIGIARLYTINAAGILDSMLIRVQNDLFDLGADIATSKDSDKKTVSLRVTEKQVQRLENEIDDMNAHIQPLKSFVLPGGRSASAYLHLARTVARRAERIIVALHNREKINLFTLQYINRLSDFLFVAARFTNGKGQGDVLWVPGAFH